MNTLTEPGEKPYLSIFAPATRPERAANFEAYWSYSLPRVRDGCLRLERSRQTSLRATLTSWSRLAALGTAGPFWSTWDQRRQGKVHAPMNGKNLWRLPMLKPHDLRHGVAMEVLAQHHDLEAVRALLGHKRLETTQLYAQIRPAELKQAVEFYEAKALDSDDGQESLEAL